MKVSVIIVVKNEAEIIGLCLDSMLAQTFKNYEIIVVDGGSTDGTADIVRSYMEKAPNKIHLFFDPGLGPGYARNLGVKFSDGEILTFMDGDDEVNPEYMESIVKHFKDPEVAGVFVKMIFRSGPKSLGRIQDAWKWMRWSNEITRFPFALKRTIFEEIKGYNSELIVGEDYDLHKKVESYVKEHKLRLETETDAIVYRVSEDTLLKISKHAANFGRDSVWVIRRYPKYGGSILAWSMFNFLIVFCIPFLIIHSSLQLIAIFYAILYLLLWLFLIAKANLKKPASHPIRFILLTPILQIIVAFSFIFGIILFTKNQYIKRIQ